MTVQTSAKARITSAAIWRISTNECPLITFLSPNTDEYGKQSLYPDGDPDRHQNSIICSMANCQPSLKISCKSVWTFLRRVANKQTDKHMRQTTTKTYPHNQSWNRVCVTTFDGSTLGRVESRVGHVNRRQSSFASCRCRIGLPII